MAGYACAPRARPAGLGPDAEQSRQCALEARRAREWHVASRRGGRAYRAALEERTRARVPLEWGNTQHNLGTVLQKLGARKGGKARLEEAVTVIRAALEELTPEATSNRHQLAQQNLDRCLVLLHRQRRKQK
jgi:hypothetical protein